MNKHPRLLSIGKAAKLLGVSIQTLRRWDKSGKLLSFRPTSAGNRYYRREDIELFINDISILGKNWAQNTIPAEPPRDYFCETRDIFEARLVRLQNQLAKTTGIENIFPLIISVAGEIGNNSFDHNLGAWPDIPGVFFGYDTGRRKIILADRGQGVLITLKRVKPALKTDEEALRVAFHEIISGRAPEARGNGLKFVRKVVIENPGMALLFQSGGAELFLGQNGEKFTTKIISSGFHGCFAVLYY